MENGKYKTTMLMNGMTVHGTAWFKDGEWYLTDTAPLPLKDGIVVKAGEKING